MKYTHLLILAALALPSAAFAQTTNTSVNADTEKALMKLEQDTSAALTKGDAATCEPLFADSFFMVAPDGATSTKAQFIADLKSGDLKLQQNQLSEMKVQAADADMAVVTYRSSDKGTYKGKDISGEYRWVDVLAKRNGKWQFVVSQGTAIAGQTK